MWMGFWYGATSEEEINKTRLRKFQATGKHLAGRLAHFVKHLDEAKIPERDKLAIFEKLKKALE